MHFTGRSFAEILEIYQLDAGCLFFRGSIPTSAEAVFVIGLEFLATW